MQTLTQILDSCAALHHHLCPRQVLGVRLGLFAGELLRLDLPQTDKRLYTIVETDGCASDGIAAATNCWVGRRTMRVEDYGKVAATFVDTISGEAIRIAPRNGVRELARVYAPEAHNKWETQLLGYQRMPAADLFSVQSVQLKTPIEQIVSRAGKKVICDFCGEEILNEREIVREGATLCRACAGESYYLIPAELLVRVEGLVTLPNPSCPPQVPEMPTAVDPSLRAPEGREAIPLPCVETASSLRSSQ